MTKKRKKILYLGNKLSAKGSNLTGVEILGEQLKHHGYELISVSDVSNKLLRLMHMLFTVLLKAKKVDVLLVDTYSTANFWYAYLSTKIARFLKLPYICILHGGDLPNRLIKSPKKCEEMFTNAKTNVAPSTYLISAFEKQGYKKLTFIPNTIAIENYPFKHRNYTTPKLLWVRSFSELYNPLLAIKIFKQLRNKYPSAELCMVGPEKDGSLEKCKQLSSLENLPVTYTGRLTKEDWINLSQEYNIFINTTNFDNTPVSVMEAMALGLPVVSTNVGGLPFLIKNQYDGVLVEKENVNVFTEAIDKIIETPEFTKMITENARKKVENFDWQVVKEKWDNVLQ